MTSVREALAAIWLWTVVAVTRTRRRLRRWWDPPSAASQEPWAAPARRDRAAITARYDVDWDAPVEGVDYSLEDIDAAFQSRLQAVGRELAGRVGERYGDRPRRAPRRRAGLVAAIALAGLAGGGAAAVALLDATTGIPSIDAVIERAGDDGDREDAGRRPDPGPGTAGPSAAVQIPAGGSARPGTLRLYAAAAGDVCVAYTAGGTGASGGRTESVSCALRAEVESGLRRDGIAVVSIAFGRQTVIGGLVAPGFTVVRAGGPGGRLVPAVGAVWRTAGDGLDSARPFAAFDPPRRTGGANRKPVTQAALRRYAVTVRTPGAGMRKIHPWRD